MVAALLFYGVIFGQDPKSGGALSRNSAKVFEQGQFQGPRSDEVCRSP